MAFVFGPMNAMSSLRERLAERRVLGQEAVARMHRLRARVETGLHDAIDDQIGLGRWRGTDVYSLVGELYVQRIAIGVRVHCDSLDAHLLRGLDDAAGDLAAVCYEDLFEHCYGLLRAECCRACATGSRASCRAASPANGKCACASRAAR